MHSGRSPKPWRVGGRCVHGTGGVCTAASLWLAQAHRVGHMAPIGCAMSANVRELPAAYLGLLQRQGGKGD